MVHMIGSKLTAGDAPHEPKKTVVINVTKADENGNAITIKTGLISTAENKYRVWYMPLFKSGEEHETVMTSPDLSYDRARLLATKQAELLGVQVTVGLDQLLEEAVTAKPKFILGK